MRCVTSGVYASPGSGSVSAHPNSALRSTSERSSTAPGAGPTSGASAHASVDLPVPERPPTAARMGAGGGQRGKPVQVLHPPRFGEVAVEHHVGRTIDPTLDQVHQQEGEVVEHVPRGDERIELDGIEQRRLAVDQCNVAEVEIAMTATDEARR